jgi:hypothetical protein
MSEKKEELTYILGAGASFQSIPDVKTFNKRFDSFVKFLDDSSKTIVQSYPESNNNNIGLKEALKVAKIIAAEFKSHQSFDTYFKKLFHTKNLDKLNLSRKIIHLYFLWEHIATIPQIKPESDDVFWKQAIIDKRYDALIAGLLMPDKDTCNLFCKTNFITWNYDLNLLESIKNYFYPEESFREFLKTKIKVINEYEWSVDGKISIINMNGYFYSNLFDEMKFIVRNKGNELLRTKVTKNYFDNNYSDNDAELIKFAWESENQVSKVAAEKINNSKNIVVIGYTFPLYNRLIDYKYFERNILINKKLYIQDPDADNIAEGLKDNFNINLDPSRLKRIKNCDSFYVPSDIIDEEIFKNKISIG